MAKIDDKPAPAGPFQLRRRDKIALVIVAVWVVAKLLFLIFHWTDPAPTLPTVGPGYLP